MNFIKIYLFFNILGHFKGYAISQYRYPTLVGWFYKGSENLENRLLNINLGMLSLLPDNPRIQSNIKSEERSLRHSVKGKVAQYVAHFCRLDP